MIWKSCLTVPKMTATHVYTTNHRKIRLKQKKKIISPITRNDSITHTQKSVETGTYTCQYCFLGNWKFFSFFFLNIYVFTCKTFYNCMTNFAFKLEKSHYIFVMNIVFMCTFLYSSHMTDCWPCSKRQICFLKWQAK